MDSEAIASSQPYSEPWRPHPRQEDALQIPDSVFEVLYGGALGGGKSEYLIMYPITRQWFRHPRFRGILFRRTFKELEKSLIPRGKDYYGFDGRQALGAIYNDTKHSFTFPSGAVIFMSHMERESDVLAHDTNEYHYVGIDQAEQFTEFQLRYIASRIRTTLKELPAVYRMGANPGGISHTYLRDRFVKPAPEGNQILIDKVTKTKRIYIPAKLEDNPSLTQKDPDYINRLHLLPESERTAKMSGDWFAFSGQVFSEFRARHFPGEPENACHVIEPFPIPQWWPKIQSIDWGFTAKTVAFVGNISPDGRVIISHEYVAQKKYIKEWGADIGRMVQPIGNLKQTVLDPSAWHERGDEKTIALQFEDASQIRPDKADNDRVGGKQLVHEYLRWAAKPPRFVPPEGFDYEKSIHILRNYGVEAQKEYENLFLPESPEANLPKLQIFSTCKELIETIPICQYDEHDKEDVEEFDGDDPYDALRYLLKACHLYMEESRATQKKLSSVDAILQDFDTATIEAQTRFYQRMAALERKTTPKGARRHVAAFGRRGYAVYH